MPYRCVFHDEVIPTRECPHGCSPAALEELPEAPQADEEAPWVTWSGEQPARSFTPIVPKRKRLRDAKGRMLPDPVTAVPASEQMTVEQIVLGLRKLYQDAPYGGQSALARTFGFPLRNLKLIVGGNPKALSMITSGTQRRMSHTLHRILTGKLLLKRMSPRTHCEPHYAYVVPGIQECA